VVYYKLIRDSNLPWQQSKTDSKPGNPQTKIGNPRFQQQRALIFSFGTGMATEETEIPTLPTLSDSRRTTQLRWRTT
jgi:hypothetical protein